MSASTDLRMGLLAGLLLAGCATVPQRAPATERLVRVNAHAQAAVAMLLPWLDPERRARVAAAAALVDLAIGRVAGAGPDEREAAVIAADRAIAAYRWEAAR